MNKFKDFFMEDVVEEQNKILDEEIQKDKETEIKEPEVKEESKEEFLEDVIKLKKPSKKFWIGVTVLVIAVLITMFFLLK